MGPQRSIATAASPGRGATFVLVVGMMLLGATAGFAQSELNAEFVSQGVPATMVAGEQYAVTIIVKNTGTTPWILVGPYCQAYRLRSENPTDNPTWRPSARLDLPGPVPAGQTAVIHAVVTAPTTTGSHPFRWRMVKECAAPFGPLSPLFNVTVGAGDPRDALFLAQSVPTTMAAGHQYAASLTIKNVGTQQDWSPVVPSCVPPSYSYRVGSQPDPSPWEMPRLNLPEPLLAGATTLPPLSFTITAPITPGTYPFQWRMIQECQSWFGALSPLAMVTVAQSWTGAGLPSSNGVDVTVPSGVDVVLDTDLDIGTLTILGKVRCDPARDTVIRTEGILVQGAGALLECGTPEARHTKKLTIELRGNREISGAAHATGNQAIAVMMGGVLRLHGRSYSRTWLRIDKHADAGADEIQLEDPVDWPVEPDGSTKIVIASTTFDPLQAEEATVTAISRDGRTLTLAAPLLHSHWGTKQSYSNGLSSPNERTWVLDERAEVGLLSRNIVIRGTPGGTLKGGHVMIVGMNMPDGRAYVDGVEFDHMGRLTDSGCNGLACSELGRYPFHWHLLGNADGQYLRNSSIHRSFQRCVTVHGTNRVLVENNVCYDHLGHGYFLENGSEIENHFVHNLGLVGKRPPLGRELLFSENRTTRILAYDPPATFWIANPNNDFVDNSAAGSMGTGYWFGLSNATPPGTTLPFPTKTNLLRFENNTAHSSLTGVALDGGPIGGPPPAPPGSPPGTPPGNPRNPDDQLITASLYEATPTVVPVFRRLTIFKTAGTGFWARADKMVVTDSVFGDNLRAATFANQQKLSDSLVVGMSDNFDGIRDNFDIDLGEIFRNDGLSNVPRGALEAVGSDKLVGWACDPDAYAVPLWIIFYEKTDGVDQATTQERLVGGTYATLPRADVAGVCGNQPNHGFEFAVPPLLNDGLPHAIYAYAFSEPAPTGSSWLTGSPRTLWPSTPVPTPPPTWIPEVFEAGVSTPLEDVFEVPVPLRIWGFGVYEGPWVMEDVHFAGFPARPLLLPDGSEIIASPFPLFGGEREATTNAASGLTFATFDSEYPPPYYDEEHPEPYRKVYLSVVDNPTGGEWGPAIIDLDRSLTGYTDEVISVVPNHEINSVDGCVQKPEWAAQVCPARYTTVRMIRPGYKPGDPTLTYTLQRWSGTSASPYQSAGPSEDATSRGQNKFGLIMARPEFGYQLYPKFDLATWTDLELFYVNPGEGTPVIRIADQVGNLVLVDGTLKSDVAGVIAANNETAYFNSGGGPNGYLYFRIAADPVFGNSYWPPYTGKRTARLCRSGTVGCV